MQSSNPVQISENCWKYTDDYGNCFYTKTSHPDSELHRENGPAVEYTNGHKEWWIDGNIIPVDSQKEFEEYLKKHEVKKIVVKEEVSGKDPVFSFRMEFNYSCKSKEDLSEEKMFEAFKEQLKKALE